MGLTKKIKKILSTGSAITGSAIIVGGAMMYNIGFEASRDLKYRGAKPIEYRPVFEQQSTEKFVNTYRTEFPFLYDLDHDGIPDVTRRLVMITGITPGSIGRLCTIGERNPTEEEIQWFINNVIN